MLVQLLQDTLRDLRTEAQDAQTAETAAVDMHAADDADAPDADGAAPDAQGEGAGGSAAGPRKSQRISQASSTSTSAHDMCELRKQLGVVSGAPEVPLQGCFCAEGCAGHTGPCTNQVPPIKTHENVELNDLDFGSNYGNSLVAKRDIEAGEILTTFQGVVLQQHKHPLAYATFSHIHKLQQQKAKGEKRFEYSAKTGSDANQDSQAWVIPPEDMPLLKHLVTVYRQESSQLKNLLKKHETLQQGEGLGQFAQHTCCPKHVNAYLFPVCIMDEAPRPSRGAKRLHYDEIIDVQALAIRAQKAIKEGDEILIHYVGAGQKGELWFDCLCCECLGCAD